MMSQVAHLPYVIYVLRLWLSSEEEIVWYFSLEDPRTGARRGFASQDEPKAVSPCAAPSASRWWGRRKTG